MTRRADFDAGYYTRFYEDQRLRVADQARTAKLVEFVASYLKYLEIPIETALDLGCGVGLWRKPLRKAFPGISYRGVEQSRYACATYGWERGSVATYRGRAADLVICQGVLQYLSARDARRALQNLARLTRGALYLEALTREDWDDNVDRERTDGDVFLRSADWYRAALGKRFESCGGGLFVPRGGAVLFELERGA